jgi:hypothetical protein
MNGLPQNLLLQNFTKNCCVTSAFIELNLLVTLAATLPEHVLTPLSATRGQPYKTHRNTKNFRDLEDNDTHIMANTYFNPKL